jgi:DNA-binding MarR family transcriptional regulator
MMNYKLVKEVIQLVEDFEIADKQTFSPDINGFKQWIHAGEKGKDQQRQDSDWEGKANGRSVDSVINTLIVHMNRYAKAYSKSAIHNSAFSTQEDFIYLINLKAFGPMTKTDLIRKNIHEKPVGMQIINRLIQQGCIEQSDSIEDKRSKIIYITPQGLAALESVMKKVRQASKIVSGNLSEDEKMQLMQLLQKLEHFHQPIYASNLNAAQLLDIVNKEYL